MCTPAQTFLLVALQNKAGSGHPEVEQVFSQEEITVHIRKTQWRHIFLWLCNILIFLMGNRFLARLPFLLLVSTLLKAPCFKFIPRIMTSFASTCYIVFHCNKSDRNKPFYRLLISIVILLVLLQMAFEYCNLWHFYQTKVKTK